MHFPEAQLTTYLRFFMPEERIDALLDQVAQAAIDSDVHDPVELYVLAHGVLDRDDRRTTELEAVVLVEEVGLAVDEVAMVLGIDRRTVEAAVAQAWLEAVELPEAEAAAPADGVAAPPEADQVRADELREDPRAEEDVAPTDEAPWRPRLPGRGVILTVVTSALLVVLAVAVFSDAGQQRIAAQGLNPVIAFGLAVGLLAVGGLLRWLGREDR